MAFNSRLLPYAATPLKNGLRFMVWHALCFSFVDGVDGNDTTEDDAGVIRNAADLLLDTVQRAVGESVLVRIHKYNSASYQTDMASSLAWDTTSFLHEGGRAGLSTSETLKTFGLVEHSIWVESTSVPDNFRRRIPNR